MSLILDALRKADSERERGSVPGLHAHPVEALAAELPARPGSRPWQWAIVGAVAGLAIAVLWYAAGRDTPQPLPEPAPGAAASPAATATAPPAAATATPRAAPATASRQPASPAPRALSAPTAMPAEPLPVAEPAPWPEPVRRKAPDPPVALATPPAKAMPAAKGAKAGATMDPAAPPAAGAAAPFARAAPVAPAAPPETPVYARDQLPKNIQAELPNLTIGGSIYSPNAPDRSLIVNGRLFRENQQLTADLSLEQIRQKSAVLRYKGYRFEIMF